MENSKTNTPLDKEESVQFQLGSQFSVKKFRMIFPKSLLTGILTFTVFLFITVLVDYIVNISSENYKIKIDTLSIFIASAGFILGFAYRLLITTGKK